MASFGIRQFDRTVSEKGSLTLVLRPDDHIVRSEAQVVRFLEGKHQEVPLEIRAQTHNIRNKIRAGDIESVLQIIDSESFSIAHARPYVIKAVGELLSSGKDGDAQFIKDVFLFTTAESRNADLVAITEMAYLGKYTSAACLGVDIGITTTELKEVREEVKRRNKHYGTIGEDGRQILPVTEAIILPFRR